MVAGTSGGPGPRKRRQPAAAPAVDALHRAQEGPGDRQRRHRPRARRLVLVPGRHGPLTRPGETVGQDTHDGQEQAPTPAGVVPARPMVCQCSSASTSFMLAALRVLHVDPSHAPAAIAWTQERPSLIPAPPPAATTRSLPPTHKATGPRRRGGGCAWSDLRSDYEQQRDSHPRKPRSLPRPAEALQPNSPSCGNQPANISLTAPSRTDTHANSST